MKPAFQVCVFQVFFDLSFLKGKSKRSAVNQTDNATLEV
jgi:hypothetical protein